MTNTDMPHATVGPRVKPFLAAPDQPLASTRYPRFAPAT
jgi:hypothetical protein